jgi:hypothetical protein
MNWYGTLKYINAGDVLHRLSRSGNVNGTANAGNLIHAIIKQQSFTPCATMFT